MITKPTVLVLGAGASQEFNFPLAKELQSIVLSNLRGVGPDSAAMRQLIDAGHSYKQILAFAENFFKSGEHRSTLSLTSNAIHRSRKGSHCTSSYTA
jgi:hypothetical protein